MVDLFRGFLSKNYSERLKDFQNDLVGFKSHTENDVESKILLALRELTEKMQGIRAGNFPDRQLQPQHSPNSAPVSKGASVNTTIEAVTPRLTRQGKLWKRQDLEAYNIKKTAFDMLEKCLRPGWSKSVSNKTSEFDKRLAQVMSELDGGLQAPASVPPPPNSSLQKHRCS